jgi:hypothetical protein
MFAFGIVAPGFSQPATMGSTGGAYAVDAVTRRRADGEQTSGHEAARTTLKRERSASRID